MFSTRTKIKDWVELFFNVKVIAMNNYQLPEENIIKIIKNNSENYFKKYFQTISKLSYNWS